MQKGSSWERGSTSALRFHPADGKPCQAASIRQMQLLTDMIPMSLNGLFAQMERAGNLFCSESLAGQLKHFELPVAQFAKRRSFSVRPIGSDCVQYLTGHGCTQGNFPLQYIADGLQ